MSPVTDETAAVTAESRPTNFEAASAAVVVPTKSPAEGSSLTNRGFDSAAPAVDVAPGRLRFDNEPPRLLCPNRLWAWHESDNTSTNNKATMSVLTMHPDAIRLSFPRKLAAELATDSFAEISAGIVGVSIRLLFQNLQVIER